MKNSNIIQSIIKEFSGKKCKLKLLTGDILTGTLSEIQQVSTAHQTVELIENVTTDTRIIFISQIAALGLV